MMICFTAAAGSLHFTLKAFTFQTAPALAQTRRPPLSAQMNFGFDAFHAVTDHRILMILRELMTLMSKHVFQPSLLLSGDLR